MTCRLVSRMARYRRLVWVGVPLAMLLTGCGCREPLAGVAGDRPPPTEYLVGAHYYVWYPSNFAQGTLRAQLRPPQQRVLGDYRSDDPAVAEQHIAWCSQYGIDVLTLDWWPRRPAQNTAIAEGFLKAANIDDIRFCIFYETWNLGFNADYGCTDFTPDVSERFVADLLDLCDRLAGHPSYLRIDGRPVFILYLSRTFTGAFAEAIATFRDRARARGCDPYLIGDEVFWLVSPIVGPGERPFPLTASPQPERMACFDAITAYNMYENGNPTQTGYGAHSTFIADVAARFELFRAAAPEVAFVPGIMPGYNDRGVRPRSDHRAIPRAWSPANDGRTFLGESFDRLALPFLDPRLAMVLITSWNEWNEDTAIEPLRPAEPTTADRGATGDSFTQGYAYEGYGMRYLEVIRDRVVAVAGRVTDAAGAPVRGVPVTFRQGATVITRATDHHGYYRIGRFRVQPGPATVGPATGPARPIAVDRHVCVADVDFVIAPPSPDP